MNNSGPQTPEMILNQMSPRILALEVIDPLYTSVT